MRTTVDEQRVDGRRILVARPLDPGPWPGVVMLHEAWGIDDVLRRQADRLASVGYLVVAPDLLGEGPWLRCIVRTAKALRNGEGRPFEVAAKARHRLTQDPGCTGRVGVIGFCMGGGFALLLSNRGFAASSVNYGMVPRDLDPVVAGACPVVASYGERDRLAREVPRLTEALDRHDVPYDVKTYPGAGHSFLNDTPNGPRAFRGLARIAGVGPEPTASADAWRRIEAFFAKHLGR